MSRKRLEIRNDDGTVTLCDLDVVHRTVTQAPTTAAPEPRSPLRFETDRYVIDRVIGRGGFADVVQAFDRRLNRDVALKLPRRDGKELRAEGEIAARLQHPNIVPVYDAGESASGSPYYAMKLLDGSSLRDVLRAVAVNDVETQERYALPRLLDVFRQVCLAVEYAHAQGVLHRDIKPANVVLGGYGEVVLADWGIARHIDAINDDGLLRGTMAYMAPERFDSSPEGTIASDVYALGASLYEVLTLSPPRRGSLDEILAQILKGPPDLPSVVSTRVIPASIEALCMAAMSDEVSDRPADAGMLAAEIEKYLHAQRDARVRRDRAEDSFARARSSLIAYEEASNEVAELAAAADASAAAIGDDAALEVRRKLWGVRADVQAGTIHREVMFGRAVRAFEQVLHDDDEHSLARAGLTQMYWDRLLEAEAEGDLVTATRYEQLVRSTGSARFVQRLGEPAQVLADCDGAAARVALWRFHRMGPILELAPVADAVATPARFTLEPGSYALRYEAEGYRSMWVPFVSRRGEHFDVVRRMYAEADVPEDFVVITGLENDFALGRHPVTAGEFTRFLDAESERGEDVEEFVPHGVSSYFRREEGRWELRERDFQGDQWSSRWPMVMVGRDIAQRYASWLSGVLDCSIRLPSKREWEWAAAGPDGRLYPWGPGVDAGCANLRTTLVNRALPLPVGSFATDRSPFGVCDMGGAVSEWTSSVDSASGAGLLKGSSFVGSPEMAKISFDRFARPDERFTNYGFRLCLDL